MYYWLIFYIPALAIAVNLPALINKVFSKDNLDIVNHCYIYRDWDHYDTHTIGFWRGQRENMLGLIYSIAMIVLVILAFFYATYCFGRRHSSACLSRSFRKASLRFASLFH